jgi:hypothetical protein
MRHVTEREGGVHMHVGGAPTHPPLGALDIRYSIDQRKFGLKDVAA